MLDLGSTSFVILPEAAKVFSIPVVKWIKPVTSRDVTGRRIQTKRLFPLPLGFSFANHLSFNEADPTFELMETSGDYDALIPAWYSEKHKARGTTTNHLHFPHCGQNHYGHGKIHPEYSITYDNRVSLNHKAIHIGAIGMSNPSVAQQLPSHYHTFLLLFNPKESEKLPDNTGCDHQIEFIESEDKLRMGPIY
jgi:hypothetical protein